MILESKKYSVVFRLDCGHDVGNGHLKRCYTIATQYPEFKYTFCIKGNVPREYAEILNNYSLYYLPESLSLDEEKAYWDNFPFFDTLICDFTNIYTKKFYYQLVNYFSFHTSRGCKIILFDGLANDSLLNCLSSNEQQQLSINTVIIPYWGASYLSKVPFRQLVGGEYFIFPDNFNNLIKTEPPLYHATHILVTLGGSDPWNATHHICSSMLDNDYIRENCYVDIVIGPSFSLDHCLDIKRLKLPKHWRICEGHTDLSELYNKAEVVITSIGLTRYEASYIRLATAVFIPSSQFFELNRYFDDKDISISFDVDDNVGHRIELLCCDYEQRMAIWRRCSELYNNINPHYLADIIKREEDE